MCKSCDKNVRIRPADDVDVSEWAKYQRARQTDDPKKLAAMLPAYIKRHLASVTIKPFVFVPNQPPRYPVNGTTVSNEAHRAWQFAGHRFTSRRFNDISEYVAEWDCSNGFKPAMTIGR